MEEEARSCASGSSASIWAMRSSFSSIWLWSWFTCSVAAS